MNPCVAVMPFFSFHPFCIGLSLSLSLSLSLFFSLSLSLFRSFDRFLWSLSFSLCVPGVYPWCVSLVCIPGVCAGCVSRVCTLSFRLTLARFDIQMQRNASDLIALAAVA